MTEDFYAVLGVASNATLAEIKKAFRTQAFALHPDRNAAPDAARKFAALNAAYKVLVEPEQRQAYDDNRRRNLLDDPLAEAGRIWQGYFSRLI